MLGGPGKDCQVTKDTKKLTSHRTKFGVSAGSNVAHGRTRRLW